jgi:hypothetical protein
LHSLCEKNYVIFFLPRLLAPIGSDGEKKAPKLSMLEVEHLFINPDPSFYLNADPDPGSQANADPCESGTSTSLTIEFLHEKYRFFTLVINRA